MEYIPKPVEELTFTDDFMFGTVMKMRYKLTPGRSGAAGSHRSERKRARRPSVSEPRRAGSQIRVVLKKLIINFISH